MVENIKEFKNKHKGKLAFLIGAGPSLYNINIDFEKYITITVNSGILKYPTCNYFVSDDKGIANWSYYRNVLSKQKCIKFLYKDKLEKSKEELENVILFSHTWWYSPKNNEYNLEGLRLTKHEPIIGARTSLGSAVHIAYIMGCNPIVLLGNDCCIKGGKRYFWQYWDKEKQPYRISGTRFSYRTQKIGFDSKSFQEYDAYCGSC